MSVSVEGELVSREKVFVSSVMIEVRRVDERRRGEQSGECATCDSVERRGVRRGREGEVKASTQRSRSRVKW